MAKQVYLKYLFQAEYFDGRIYKQNREDTSQFIPIVTNPDGSISGKSAFTDIKEDAANGLIKQFKLVENVKFAPRTFLVDLEDGHFEVNGERVNIESEELPPNMVSLKVDYRLVYYRTRRQQINVSYETRSGAVLGANDGGELSIQFVFGWQATVSWNMNGEGYQKNYQEKMRIE